LPHHQVLLHRDGPALWPLHKPLPEVLEIRETTPELVWSGTYQGVPTPPGGYIFKRHWWMAERRYDIDDTGIRNLAYQRFLSWDTALKDDEEADLDFSAYTVAEIWPDYRLGVRRVHQERLEFPYLPDAIAARAMQWNYDEKLHGVLIEDKSSGTSALQTLAATSPTWLKQLLIPFVPTTDKISRAQQAAVWCRNGCVLLPRPTRELYWLMDFEEELFSFPQAAHDDRVDSFVQLVLYLEHILAAGRKARGEG